jgi:leucyl-tRNA synthetase
MKRYNPSEIEPKQQQAWSDQDLYAAVDFSDKPKYVMLTEFPYPSGDGLHLGHTREYTLGDIMARHKRMQGYNVLYPMGYDAFGLPTENYAIKNKIAPQVATDRNVGNFQKQFEKLGLSIDWSRSFRTTEPDYYKWTQWLFLQFFKKGLAYQEEVAINWCPHCKTGLANEEVVNGRHERCDTLVEKKQLNQWLLKITDYADRLIDGLKDVDFPSRIADQQINWIGRSQGAEVDFELVFDDEKLNENRGPNGEKAHITVFTTRPDTIYGATFLVLAPEHRWVQLALEHKTVLENNDQVAQYVQQAGHKTELDRQSDTADKTGVHLKGVSALNPLTGEKIPLWTADYVLAGYGTGAIMAVPAHDERDFAFAKKYNLPIVNVVDPVAVRDDAKDKKDFLKKRKVVVLVDNKAGEILTINWGQNMGGRLTIGGTIEGDESPEATALREVAEEAGYTDLEVIESGKEVFHYKYFAFSKDEAHDVEAQFVHVRLRSDKRQDQQLDESEKNKFSVEWVTPEQAEREIVEPLHRYNFEKFVKRQMFTGSGVMRNSGEFDGLENTEAKKKIVAKLESEGKGRAKVTFKLRDWIFSRQHYWGEPIPIIHCAEHGAVAVPDDQLPVTLPDVEQYEPTDTGESPLAAITDWVNVTCPECGGLAKRETDTMPNWAGSSWYYLRYFDAHNDKAFADRKKLDYWGAVDMYLGGMEHTTLHLLYSRFWHQFFYDMGLVPTPEPYAARRGQGIILAADGSKMSKSKGNVINPNEVIDAGYGADALRVAIAFIAPYDLTTPWSPEGVAGTHRFLNRVWTLVQEFAESQTDAKNPTIVGATHAVIKRVSTDLQNMQFNTSVSALMEFVNVLYKEKLNGMGGEDWKFALSSLLQLVAPIAPHIADELWAQLGNEGSIHVSQWPSWDESKIGGDSMTIIVQVNGKLRAKLEVAKDTSKDKIEKLALEQENVQAFLDGNAPKKVIYVPGKLVSIVV